MGVSWRSDDQKSFIDERIPSYIQHIASGTVKTGFWPSFLDEWFKAWPVPELTPDPTGEEGNAQKAPRSERGKRISVSTIYLLTDCLELTIHVATEARLQSGC